MTQYIQWKASQWQDASGRWCVNCVDDLAGCAGLWYIPCRILDLDPVDFILLLKNKYNVNNFSFNNNILLYSWNKESDAHKFLLMINRVAREKKIKIKK